MAKDLPYFKFFCSEWNDGDITLESYEAQGVFINICSYYWSNECNVNFDKLLKKFRGCEDIIDDLSAEGLFKLDDYRNVCISFLDEQKAEREKSRGGKVKGGLASAEKRRLKKEQEVNTSSTEVQQVLNSSSTEVQLLREDKIREDKIREDKIREENITTPAKAEGIDFKQLLLFINKTLGKSFRTINPTLQAKYKARLKDGYTKEDIQKAIIGASKSAYHLETNYKHLRPDFFSRADKIDMYSNSGTVLKTGLSMAEQIKHIKTNIKRP